MKKVILLALGALAGIFLYQKFDADSGRDETALQSTEAISVEGKVAGNLSVMGQSVYELVNLSDTTESYYVVVKGETPAIGEIRNVSLAKFDILTLNDHRVSIYMEQSKSGWIPF